MTNNLPIGVLSQSNSEAGPSNGRSVRSTQLPSSDFGAFESAPAARDDHISAPLDESDLLGSFEELADSGPSKSVQVNGLLPHDLLGEEIWDDGVSVRTKQDHSARPSSGIPPIHVTLPPRPSEISPNYVPHMSRRLSLGFPGPSSPPLVSTTGNDIVYHPPHRVHDAAAEGMRRLRHQSEGQTPSGGSRLGSPRSSSDSHDEPSHPSLLNTLATTTKLASKWKSVVGPSSFMPPSAFDVESNLGAAHVIDVTHTTPFATSEQISGSYIPPSGAPSFHIVHGTMTENRSGVEDTELPKLSLLVRRETTAPVLTETEANRLRRFLPPRQRLSNGWSLLFSLDQHGASLSSLYRNVDNSAQTHPGAGNLLIVKDAKGNKFGVYLNEALVKRDGIYYGSGESFLFKLADNSEDPKIFRWTGKNQYFALCESSFISFGGGSGPSYGLILDSSFSRCSSASSPAYDNEVLCEIDSRMDTRASSFECLGLEVWATS